MLSRVADLVYWMARHLERAENTARILDVNTQLALDLQRPTGEDPRAWEPMIHVAGQVDRFNELYDAVTERNVVDFLTFNRKNPSSIVSCIAQARENARCVREQMSGETWEQLNRFHLRLHKESIDTYLELGANEYLNRVKLSLQLFDGIAGGMLPRNEGWHFYKLGRLLERADNTSRLIDVKYFSLLPSARDVGTAIDTIQWAAVLRSCSAFEAFRKNRRGQITSERVIGYLILDEFFPRSIRFAITGAEESIRRITRDSDHHFSTRPSRHLGRLRADLDYAEPQDIIAGGLHEWIDTLQLRIAETHTAIEETFFDYDAAKAVVLE